MIAPASLRVLTVHDQFDGAFHRVAQLLVQLPVVNHAVGLGQKQGAKPMAVHGAMKRPLPADEIALAIVAADHVLQGARNHLAVDAATGLMAAGHEGQAGEAGNGNIAVVRAVAERAVAILPRRQVTEPLVDGPLRLRRDHVLGSAAVRKLLAVPGTQFVSGKRQAQHSDAGLEEESATGIHCSLPYHIAGLRLQFKTTSS